MRNLVDECGRGHPEMAPYTERLRLFLEVLRIRLYQARALRVGPRDLVLDLGSGSSPNLRANVLCDKFVSDGTDRLGAPLAHPAERPFIIGDAHSLPFKDHAFDCVVCSHLLEHVADPARVLAELQRVARRGYIETPSRVAEKMHSLPIHKWLVGVEGETLVFEAKPAAVIDPELFAWFEDQMARNTDFRPLWMKQWQSGLIAQYWWEDTLPCKVRGEPVAEGLASATCSVAGNEAPPAAGLMARVDSTYGRWLRRHSQARAVDLLTLLACPICHGGLHKDDQNLECAKCQARYPYSGTMPVLLPESRL